MRSRTLVVLAALAGAVLVLLPFGGGAIAATSSGADGDIAFVRGGNILLASTGTPVVTGAVGPSWSPDGKKLAFSAGGNIETCTVSSCTPGGPIDTGTQGEPVWSPDGSLIAYVVGGDIWTALAAGGGQNRVTSVGSASDPTWSPTATGKIAFVSGGAVYTVDASGGGTPALLSFTGGFTGPLSHPAWSPDGSSIAFQASDGTNMQIWVAAASGGATTKVTTDATDHTAPSWAPTSDALVFSETGIGIFSSTQGVGGAWGTPVQHDIGADLTPDWQTIAPQNVAPPSINGGVAPQTGQLLTATNGTWVGASAVGFAYQWQRCDASGNNCSPIGTNSSSYAVVSADVGSTLRVIVTAVNVAGQTQSPGSTHTGVVTLAGTVNPPVNTSYPVITLPFTNTTGVPNIGDTLSVSNGTWAGSFPITFTYQWKKCDSPAGSCYRIPGATRNTFTITSDLYGMSIRAEVTATNSAAAVAQNSESTKVITAIKPFLRVTPQITGTVMVGQTLALTPGTWDGSLPLTYTYSWRRCNPTGDLPTCVEIATTATYIPVVADIGAAIRVWITATNPAGSDQGITNHTYPVVDKPHFAPTASDSPLVVGTLEVGGILTASVGTFSGDLPITTVQQWQRCDATGAACHNIKNATKQVYHPTSSDVGSTLRLVVTATNLYGKAVSISDVTEPVIPKLPHIKGITIVGTDKNDYLIGTLHDDLIKGLAGNDTINGDGGYDTIYGGAGNDVINVAGPGTSHVYGGSGSDTIYAANGEKDYIDCGSGNDRAVIDAFDVVHNCEVVQVGSGSGN
jgi:RTX calcium-binding nonapeptide repeat (4 copies)/WD40-like Beta Propeller Repeat